MSAVNSVTGLLGALIILGSGTTLLYQTQEISPTDCDTDYVAQSDNFTTVKPFDWSSLKGQSYSWYTRKSLLAHVLNGDALVSAPQTPLVQDGAPNPPFLPAATDIPEGILSRTYWLEGEDAFSEARALHVRGIDPRDPRTTIEPPMATEDLAIHDEYVSRVERREAVAVEYVLLSDWLHGEGFFHFDSDNLECGIAQARSGTTLLLEPGTFYLGAYRKEDASLISSGRGEPFSHSKNVYPFFNRSPDYNYVYDVYGGFGNGTEYPWPAVMVINKPLTISGRYPADGPNATKITTPQGWSAHGETLYTDAAWFVLASPDVTVRQIKFTDVIKGIEVIQAGTTIEDNVFEDSGDYSCQYIMDNASAFPNYPALNPVRQSYLRRNKWNRVIAGPYIYGSGVIATDNELKLGADRHSQSSFGFIYGGGIPLPPGIPMEVSMARENRIERNTIEGFSSWGALYVAGHRLDGIVSGNTFADNEIYNMYAIIQYRGHSLFMNNRITGNTIERAPLGVLLDSHSNGANPPEGNHFSGNTYRNISRAGVELTVGIGNSFSDENFSDSGLPGWAGGGGLFFLGEATYGNQVNNIVIHPTTTICDQILDLGANLTPDAKSCEKRSR